jgi:hypothetical protein
MTSTFDTTVTTRPGAPLSFEATDVTGTKTLQVQVQGDLSADAAAESVASLMALPSNVPWALRIDSSSAFLEGNVAIGDQIVPGEHLTVTPKTHLG